MLAELQKEKQWTINILRTLLGLQREPTKQDIIRILDVLEDGKEKPPADSF